MASETAPDSSCRGPRPWPATSPPCGREKRWWPTVADPSQAALAAPAMAAPAKAGAPPRRPKYRIRFRKAGDLRLVSHHDLMNCFERMLRRAALPFHSTEGFNPRPRLVFALSLALGIAGREEVADLELDGTIDPDEIRDRLAR